MLEDLLDAADKPTTKQLQIAIDASGSNNEGIASNGARDALAAGDRVAALGKLAAAQLALRDITSLDASMTR
jgi:hypothetical protein